MPDANGEWFRSMNSTPNLDHSVFFSKIFLFFLAPSSCGKHISLTLRKRAYLQLSDFFLFGDERSQISLLDCRIFLPIEPWRFRIPIPLTNMIVTWYKLSFIFPFTNPTFVGYASIIASLQTPKTITFSYLTRPITCKVHLPWVVFRISTPPRPTMVQNNQESSSTGPLACPCACSPAPVVCSLIHFLADAKVKKKDRLIHPSVQCAYRFTSSSVRPTVVWNKQESSHKYWATHSSVCSFTRTTHSFPCSGLLALLAPSAALSCLLARSLRSLPRSWDSEWLDVSKWPGFVP